MLADVGGGAAQGDDAGLSKDELMEKADALGVSKDPMGGKGGWCAPHGTPMLCRPFGWGGALELPRVCVCCV